MRPAFFIAPLAFLEGTGMKLKKWRKEMRKALPDAVRLVWAKLCVLPRRERWRLAWLLVRGVDDLERAVKK